MKPIKFIVAIILMFTLQGFSSRREAIQEIIVCGDDKVLIIDLKNSGNEDVKVNWEWNVGDASDLSAEMKKVMVPTDDCKPVDNGKKILITSSGGGVVLIERKTKKCLFWAKVPMAHSAEYLPGGRIAVALSTHEAGNSLEIYDVKKPNVVLFRDSLYSGHGVVWIPETKHLYALGFNVLREYSLLNWDTEGPGLQLIRKWKTPDNGGHDLTIVSPSELLLTTTKSVWRFDIKNEKFIPFEMLKDASNIKSVNLDPKTGGLVYTKAEISWWTHHIYCLNPEKVLTIPGINLYKVRTFPK